MANLGKLIKQADAAAESASRLVFRAMREVRGELALLADELNLTGSAADRDKAYQMIQKKMARLSRRLDALMDAQNHLAGKTAAKSAEEMTGLEVKYSAARANAIIELVTPAQGENLAAVFTQNMAANSIRALQEATVAVMREQAVAGGTMKEMKKALGERWQKAISAPPVFTDAGGHTWDTGAYLQMNIRTNTMRVYNDCLVDDVARTTGSDLVRVSTGGDPMCRLCAPWEGVILSVSGKTKGFPTYEQARQAGCFHPNCVHTIETVDDVWDGDEIELQKAHPVTKETATDPDAMDERKYKIDQERYRRKGMDAEAARLAVDRDNLEANIRHGLIRSDARAIVDKLTDAQVTALCKDGNPPRFEPTKKATKKNPHAADEKFIRGKRGGVVHISRNATVEDLLKVTGVKDAKMPEPPKVEEKKSNTKTIDAFKTAEECKSFIKNAYDINIVGMAKFPIDDIKEIAKSIARAIEAGMDRAYCTHVSTGQDMFQDMDAKNRFLEARANAKPDSLYFLSPYRWKGEKKGYKDADAEWYGLCQDLRATGRTAAHTIRFKNPILKIFNGVYFNAKAPKDKETAKRCVESGWWTPGGETLGGTMAHELGHALSSTYESKHGVRLSDTPKLRSIVKSNGGYDGISKNLSRYGATKNEETIAEAWCEFTVTENPRPLAIEIGNMILYALKEGNKDAI